MRDSSSIRCARKKRGERNASREPNTRAREGARLGPPPNSAVGSPWATHALAAIVARALTKQLPPLCSMRLEQTKLRLWRANSSGNRREPLESSLGHELVSALIDKHHNNHCVRPTKTNSHSKGRPALARLSQALESCLKLSAKRADKFTRWSAAHCAQAVRMAPEAARAKRARAARNKEAKRRRALNARTTTLWIHRLITKARN